MMPTSWRGQVLERGRSCNLGGEHPFHRLRLHSLSDGGTDGCIEGVCIGEGLVGEVMAFEVEPAPFDVPSIAEHEKRWEKMPWRNCF